MMSSQEICRDAASPLEKAEGRLSSHYDFSFAFCNLQFSDCTLRVLQEDAATPSSLGSPPSDEFSGEDIPVSTVVLVAKSLYFRQMFTGSFRERLLEGGGRSVVEIRVTVEDKPFFMDLLKFIYTGSLSEEAASSFHKALKLLILADRFDTPDCVSECSAVLDAYASKDLQTADALLLISLPESLQQLPNLRASMTAAKACLVKDFSNSFNNPSDHSFLQLPEAGVEVLLEAENLKISSEDVLARASLAWICHHYAEPRDRLDVLLRLVLPSIRFQSLSPKQVSQVCNFIKDPSKWQVSHFLNPDAHISTSGSSATRDAQPTSPLAPVQFTEISPSDSIDFSASRFAAWYMGEGATSLSQQEGAAKSSQLYSDKGADAQERLEALTSALVSVSEHALMHSGTIPRGATLESCLTGRPKLPPRLSCRPPCSIYLDIPERLCRDWQTSSEHLATSAPTCANGRWFTLQAKIYPSESTLHVQLSCDKRFPGGEFSSFQIELQLCLQTADSRPAYLQQTRKALCKYTSASASFGCRDFLGKPLSSALDQASLYFPEGALRLRADVWLMGEGE